MEFSKTEVMTVERAENEAAELQLTLLTDLQLANVGGGGGDVAFG